MKTLKFLTFTALIFCLCGFSPKEDNLIKTKVVARVEIPTWYHEGLYFDGKNIWVANGLKGMTWVVDPGSGKVSAEIKPVGTFTEAVTSRSKDVYIVTDWDSKKIYTTRIENNNMAVEKEALLAPAHPTGAVWNGKNLFVITWTRSIAGTKFHLLKMDDEFNILNRHGIDNIQEPCQIAWDGKSLWVSSWYDNKVYKVDADTFDILGYFKSPVKKTTGVAWDGMNLWVTGTYSDLYKIEMLN
ncbi:MAG: hypothetical protein Q8R38_07545 [Candidatus Omnitrophota bacterium]|nr:hypothetical protein [Candidatus Omnitrophota bacterium]